MKTFNFLLLGAAVLFFGCEKGVHSNENKPETKTPPPVAVVKEDTSNHKVTEVKDTLKAVTCNKKEVMKIGNVSVFKLDSGNVYYFKSKFAVDADGAPHAYNPQNTGLDYNQNAQTKGTDGKWHWSSTVVVLNSQNEPILQGATDPAPGYCVSKTSLMDRTITNDGNPKKYVNSEEIPYYVLPKAAKQQMNCKLGDFGVVYNTKTKKFAYAIFADGGPAGKIGEGSIRLASDLGLKSSPKNGGTDALDIMYFIFPGTGNQKPRTLTEINELGKKALDKVGGVKLFELCN